MKFGEKLQSLRKSRGMSQEQLASQVNVSRQAISKWELGESNPDIEYIIQISNIFNVTTDYLLKDEEEISTREISPQGNANFIKAQILLIASIAFLAIGLFCAFGGWQTEQNPEVIWGSIVIQVVGVVAYFIGKIFLQSKVPLGINMVNLAIGLFMPISMIALLLSGRKLAPYPTDIYTIVIFGIMYIVTLILSYILLKKQQAK